jgi:hypothetical protein
MRHRSTINRDWRFALGDPPGADRPEFDDSAWQRVGLPRSCSLPYFQESSFYVGAGWYRRELVLTEEQLSGVVRLDFEGAFQVADVHVNGVLAARHEGGYTGFAADISPLVRPGPDIIAVRVDNTWNPEIAPLAGEHVFSGGLYRDVWLEDMGRAHVDWYGTRVTTPGLVQGRPLVRVETEVRNAGRRPVRARLTTRVLAPDGFVVASVESPPADCPPGVATVTQTTDVVRDPRLWSPETPALYRAVSELVSDQGEVLDRYETRFGFRYFTGTADRASSSTAHTAICEAPTSTRTRRAGATRSPTGPSGGFTSSSGPRSSTPRRTPPTRARRTTTTDFRSFSEPRVWHDPGHSVIDSAVIKHNGSYYRYTKDERDQTSSLPGAKFITSEKAGELTSADCTFVSDCIGRGEVDRGEGPAVFKSNTEEKWYMFIDEFGGRGYVPFETTDLDSGQWTPSKEYQLPPYASHGSVLPVTRAEYDRLLSAYGD